MPVTCKRGLHLDLRCGLQPVGLLFIYGTYAELVRRLQPPYLSGQVTTMDDFRDRPEPRHSLPGRRLTETRKVTTKEGHTVYLSVGFDPRDPLRPREVFYSAGFKSGSQLEFLVQDACVLVSLLLQHGHHPREIAKSLSRVERADSSLDHGSIVGMIVEELSK